MNSLGERLSRLTPEKRALLEKRLRQQATGAGETAQAIPKRAEAGPAPLSFTQRRLWFLDRFEPGNAAYVLSSCWQMRGPLNRDALQRSLAEIIGRHEVLRTVYVESSGEPQQVVLAEWKFALPLDDLSVLVEDVRLVRAERITVEELARPFDLASDLMLRARLLRLADDDHILLTVFHHIAFDGWSYGVFWRELNALYTAGCEQRELSLPAPALQFSDFATWQRQQLQGTTLEKELSYWKEKLAHAPSVLEVPTEYPRPAMQSFHGAREPVTLSQPLLLDLLRLARNEQSTLFMILLAAWKILLWRYSGQTDVLVGTPIAGRTSSELEEMIGFFANTLALRTDLSGNPTFRELVERVRETTLGAYAHQNLPFEKLVEEVRPERSLSNAPLIQVMLILRNMPGAERKLGDIAMQQFAVAKSSAMFDLTLALQEEAEGLRGNLEYNTDIFSPAFIRRLLRHYETLLAGIVAQPDGRIGALPLLAEDEREQLLVAWNDTQRSYPLEETLPAVISRQAELNPDSTVLQFEGRSFTWRELDQHASRLAQHLRHCGVGPDVLVAICLERSADLIVGLLAIHKAGGAYVPLDPSYPADRLQFVLDDSQALVLVTSGQLAASLFPHCTATIVEMGPDAPWRNAPLLPASGPAPKPDDLAYVLYTSGSTGRPKGVQISHRSVMNFLHSMREYLSITKDDVVLAITTCAFDISVLEIFLPLMVGGRMMLVTRDVASDGRLLADAINHSGVTLLQATPATWEMLLAAGWNGNRQLKALCGGEALSPGLAARILAQVSTLWNMYGPTETTVWSTMREIHRDDTSISIGRPIANTKLYVLDVHGQPVPVGIPGELYIGGAGLARGYLRRPDLTAEKFLPDPFSSDPQARMYRTGDQVRWSSEGELEYLGRLDFQVKLRGHRIEPGEIETLLMHHSAVRQAVVMIREDSPGNRQLVAYVLPTDMQQSTDATALRDHLRTGLPEYMIPGAFVALESFPLTPNGKVDRKRLPEPARTGAEDTAGYVAPRNPVEQQLAGIWSQVLGIDRVSVHDNFFDLGGHSLLAVKLFAEMERQLHCRLPLAELFRRPTIARLVELIKEPKSEEARVAATLIQSGGNRSPLFLLPSMGGEVLYWKNILAQEQWDCPVYAVGISSRESPWPEHVKLQEIASYYADCIRSHANGKPVHLAGYSFGGILAFEVACQLAAGDQPVGVVAIIDTGVKSPASRTLAERLAYLAGFVRNLPMWIWDDVLRSGPRMWLSEIRRKSMQWRGRLDHWLGRQSHNDTRIEVMIDTEGLPEDYKQRMRIAYRAMRGYQPGQYAGRIVLLRARTRPLLRGFSRDLGWNRLVPAGVHVVDIPGNHATILHEPHSRTLAQKLKASLTD